MTNYYAILHWRKPELYATEQHGMFYLGEYDTGDELGEYHALDDANNLCHTLGADSFSLVTDMGDLLRTVAEDKA